MWAASRICPVAASGGCPLMATSPRCVAVRAEQFPAWGPPFHRHFGHTSSDATAARYGTLVVLRRSPVNLIAEGDRGDPEPSICTGRF